MHYPLAEAADDEGSLLKPQPYSGTGKESTAGGLGLEQSPIAAQHSGPGWWPPRWWLWVVGRAPAGWRHKMMTVATAIAVLLLVGVSVLIDGIAEMTEVDGGKGLAQCSSPDGGGVVAAGGLLSTQPSSCTKQLKSYFSSDDDQNAYLSEMSSITSSALTYLTTLAHQQPWASSNRRPLVVLGVDDTALSNLQFFGLGSDFRTKSGPAFAGPYNRRRSMLGMGAAHAGGAAGLSEAQRSLLENDGDSGSSTDRLVLGPGWGQAVNLPALSPVLQLYTQLQGLGYAVAFVTSRSEGTRANTTANLASAGYGTQCSNGSSGSQASPPCYAALLMRAAGDTRLSSEVKPDLRSQLLGQGSYTLVASIGDQVSDLTGPIAAPASYKLPNPVYLVL